MTNPLVHELVDLLALERLEDNLFRGASRDIGTKYVFGGQVLGQALSAAQRTVDDARRAHSLHAYFLRAGDIDAPIVYTVDRARDGARVEVDGCDHFTFAGDRIRVKDSWRKMRVIGT